MPIKKFVIEHEGLQHDIEFEDDLSFGDVEYMIQNTVDLTDVTKPKVKLQEFRVLLMLKALRKAPFDHKNIAEVRKVPYSMAKKIIEELQKAYPLSIFLGDWMTSFVGLEEEKSSVSESTPSVQSNTDGPKTKSTNAQQSGSKN